MEQTIAAATDGDVTLRIVPDDDPIDPREHDCNLGTMVCWHRRHRLGDKHDFATPEDFLGWWNGTWSVVARAQKDVRDDDEVLAEDFVSYQAAWDWMLAQERSDPAVEVRADTTGQDGVLVPVWLIDHSGLAMQTGPFALDSQGWDSGQVGWIYATGDQIRTWFGSLTDETKDDARQALEFEVWDYSCYLAGDTWGYLLERSVPCNSCGHAETEVIDSCWGFSGRFDEVGLADYLGSDFSHLVPHLA